METSKPPEALRLALASDALADERELIHLASWVEIRNLLRADSSELRRLHTETIRLQAERDALNAALRRLYVAAPIGLKCSDFHHSKREQHSAMSECSQVTEYLAALEQARAAISTATGAAA